MPDEQQMSLPFIGEPPRSGNGHTPAAVIVDAEASRTTPKPYGKWAVQVEYDPDKGLRQEDFYTESSEYEKRFRVRPTITPETGDPVHPEFSGILMEPVETSESWRWRPRLLSNMADFHAFMQSDHGQQKRARESWGDSLGFEGVTSNPVSNTSLIDTEFIPLMGGPFFKQLYLYDYLLMHARAFEAVNHNALAASIIKIMQRFSLGRGISFHIKNDQARMVWEEFWERNRMRHKLREIARDLPWQGEIMLRLYDKPKRGYVAIRVIDCSTCWEVVTDPEDIEHVYYFHFQWPCLRGDVKIACLDGTNPTIAELAERQKQDGKSVWVYSYDHETKRIVPGEASKVWKTGRKRCVEVELDNGEKVVTSYDHPFLMRDGQYVHAEKLKPGDSLMPLYRRQGYEEIWQPESRWEYTHHVVAQYSQRRKRRKGEVVHHLDENRAHNLPGNLSFMPKPVHDAETSARRWSNPDLIGQRESWVQTMSASMTKHWKKGTYKHLTGKGARKKYRSWRKGIADGVKASWKDSEKRARRVEAMRAAGPRGLRNHKVVVVRPAGTHVVYDMQVEKHHNFALASGVFTHNTPYQIWTSGQIPVSRYIIQQVPPTNVMHVKINCSSQEKRGRSDLLPSLPWLKRFNDYYNGVTVKAMLEANLVWKIKVKGDQADVDAFLTNPALTQLPPPGGHWIENEAVNLEAVTAQMTASRGSMGIGGQIAAIVATSVNLPPEYLNIEQGGAARATALVRTDPAVKTIEDRQQLLRETLEDLYDRVITAAILGGRISPQTARHEPETTSGPMMDEDSLFDPGDTEDEEPVPSQPVSSKRTPVPPSRKIVLR